MPRIMENKKVLIEFEKHTPVFFRFITVITNYQKEKGNIDCVKESKIDTNGSNKPISLFIETI